MAGCKPEEAVMIGDRLDYDIRPAKELGMRTIRIRQGITKYLSPCYDAETPVYTVNSLSELLDIL